ncbi:aspartate ammonia-lyase [Methylobacterium sp. NEAU 140]|uniref:aspartate ammonia-lyase n=1 Tax=Methylobacterium sp. NEAU 140 TaxID=3064945 RepID=UPI00273282F4|nr:aspartate ammonia-lyase [Methylobacterium sp. NEAU 140]MDP4026562.1 aspartate ammonia-lyase [Methylobacterium sp. NEAU 140]
MSSTRLEKDSLGQVELPADVLYGINTFRSLANFPISGRPIATYGEFIRAIATVKQAAAQANLELGGLTPEQAAAITAACEEVRAGRHDAHFVVDMFEGSGGTSTNMNVNEVIANVAARNAGQALGEYAVVHPNDHVNLGQSTNDVIPTALKLAVYGALAETPTALRRLAQAFSDKAAEYADLLRLGRTCLQDAQPMTLGQAFGGYAAVIARHADELEALQDQFLTVPLGGTAIGTGFGAQPGYTAAVCRHLAVLTGAAVKPASNAFDAMQNMDNCARLSAELRNTANTLWKIANDLIILSSGPMGGLEEITLPSVQAGSSIMPGKVNPVIPMAVCQVALAVTGNDTAVTLACQQGLLEINHYELIVCDRLLESIRLLTRTATVFTDRCVSGLVGNAEASRQHLLNSSALATALVPALGYAQVSGVVRAAVAEQRPFIEVAMERGLLREDEIQPILYRATHGAAA